jgi:hypothetical protein
MSAHATIAERIRTLMADGKPRTAAQIAKDIKAIPARVNDFLRLTREPGFDQEFRAFDRGGYRKAIRYVRGRGENVQYRNCPPRRVARRSVADKWWPAADVVVLRSFDEMVRGARA